MPQFKHLDEQNALCTEVKVFVTETTFRERSYFAEAWGFTLRMDEPFGTRIGAPYNPNIEEYSRQYFQGPGGGDFTGFETRPLEILYRRMETAIHSYIQALCFIEKATAPAV